MKKITFAIYDMGAGHRSTASALKAVIEQNNLPWEIETVEILEDVFNTTFSQDFYNRWILKRKWAKLINDPISVPIFKARIKLMHRIWRSQLEAHWKKTQPDMVVSLMPLFNKVLCESVNRALPHAPFVTAVTDFADCPKHFWIEQQNQHLISPSKRVTQQAKASRYPDKNLFQTSGIVIHPRYNESLEINAATQREQLGLHPDLPTGLVCFGSHGSREMLEIARRLNNSNQALQLIFICGRNQKLIEQLRQLPTHYPKHVEGFTRELPTYMKTADFFIGKPGSVGVSEAIALGLPVITECNQHMTLFQERATADWITQNQFGKVVSSFSQIAKATQALLKPSTYEHYKNNVEKYENKAAFEVIEILQQILEPSESETMAQAVSV